jgi:hypothetical protein
VTQQYRWSGLAGVAGGLLFIFVFVFVGVVVGADTSIATFPDIRAGRTVENTLYLAVLLLWVAPFLALGRALRESSPAAASYGSVLAVLGLGVLAAGALPHVASVSIADLYHVPGADQAALAAAWQVNQGIMNMLLVTGLAIVPVGVVGLGVAMLGAPGFGTGIGRASVALGLVGVAAAVVLLIDPLSPIAVVGYLALIAFHVAVGRRLYALSRVPAEAGALTAAVTGRSAG